MPGTTVDARGMRCPWPALRLARAMRAAGDGDTVTLLADDPAAPREIAALVAERDWLLNTDNPNTYVVNRRIGGIVVSV